MVLFLIVFKMRNVKSIFLVFVFLAIGTLLMNIVLKTCGSKELPETADHDPDVAAVLPISEQEILAFQQQWGEGIVHIGRVYKAGGDYVAAAREHIERFYGYGLGPVLFKPTLASQKQFRTDEQGALSYFVAGNPSYPEDHGFALKPWREVRWESAGIKVIDKVALSMGNYYFLPDDGGPAVKVEYSFAYTRDEQHVLRIVLHGSHKPFVP